MRRKIGACNWVSGAETEAVRGLCMHWGKFGLAQRPVAVLEALCNGVTRYLRCVRAVWRLHETEVWVAVLGRRYDLIC